MQHNRARVTGRVSVNDQLYVNAQESRYLDNERRRERRRQAASKYDRAVVKRQLRLPFDDNTDNGEVN